jgi:hypothetical protein
MTCRSGGRGLSLHAIIEDNQKELMQTILMFGGNRYYPKGGSEDLLGVLPFVSEDVILGTMREIIKLRFGDSGGSYWCNLLVVRDGKPAETRRWRLVYDGTGSPHCHTDETLVKTEPGKDGFFLSLIRRPDEDDEDWASHGE